LVAPKRLSPLEFSERLQILTIMEGCASPPPNARKRPIQFDNIKPRPGKCELLSALGDAQDRIRDAHRLLISPYVIFAEGFEAAARKAKFVSRRLDYEYLTGSMRPSG
jgi:hypothetical protein